MIGKEDYVYHVVVLREYERGWGSKDFLAYHFDTQKEAEEKVLEHNKENNESIVPDYYIVARYVDKMTKREYDTINR